MAGNDAVYVRGYIGDYDAHHYRWPRTNIGCWDRWNEIGLRPKGEFEVPFKDLLPGKRYYYRMFASRTPDFPHPYLTCRWANGVGSFITATEDGKPGQVVFEAVHRQPETTIYWHIDDRYITATRQFHQISVDPAPGPHLLVLIDDQGRRLERRFTVLNRSR